MVAARRVAQSARTSSPDRDGHERARLSAVAVRPSPITIVIAIALFSRVRHGIWSYDGTYGSGDAHLILLKALFVSEGKFRTTTFPVGGLFSDPPALPLLFGTLNRLTGVPIEILPLIVTPLITIAGLAALYSVVHRSLGNLTALLGVSLVALLPRFSFDSTEPDKVAFVVSFFLIAVFFLYEGQRRRWMLTLAGLFMGLAVFSHTTGYVFLPVFALSYLAVTLASHNPLLNRSAVIAMLLPALFMAAHFTLDSRYPPGVESPPAAAGMIAAPAPAPSVASAVPQTQPPVAVENRVWSLVPENIERELRSVWTRARNGFDGSAGNVYYDAIERQVGTRMFILALAGFVVASATMVRRRSWGMAPLLLWIAVVTLGFAAREPASSHGSRYPSYVTPVFVVFAAYVAVRAGEETAAWARGRRAAIIALAPALILAALTAHSYITAPNPGLRALYAPHHQLADYLGQQHTLDDGSRILYLGWPSITFFLLSDKPSYEPRLETFGWGAIPLDRYTPEYLTERHVRYFVYDKTGSDYFRSADALQQQLLRTHQLIPVSLICQDGPTDGGVERSCGSYVILYEVRAFSQGHPSQLLCGDLAPIDAELTCTDGALDESSE